jgi:hypothetical protein
MVTDAAKEFCTRKVDISDDAWTAVLLIHAAMPMMASRTWLGAFVVGVGKLQHLRSGCAVKMQPRREARHLRAALDTTTHRHRNRASCRI